jgi:cyclic pyranopterin phosphate synthase
VDALPIDRLNRRMRDLRISVTDRCNFRCTYCMPKEIYGTAHPFLPRSELLSFEEIAALAAAFARNGVEKLRITGGEPLLRRDLPKLIEMLRGLPGIREIALTTNGALLAQHAHSLRSAGVDRLTVSVDAVTPAVFRAMNDVGFPVDRVLEGIVAAQEAGFTPIKINAVIRRSVNEDQIVPLARRFLNRNHILRFIEYMDVGETNGWKMEDVVPGAEILRILEPHFALAGLPPNYPSEVAKRFAHAGPEGGEIGLITSVTRPFCGDCTRARLSADGRLYTCLFSGIGHDLRGPLRSGASHAQIDQEIRSVWNTRSDRYSELRFSGTPVLPKPEMSRLGG